MSSHTAGNRTFVTAAAIVQFRLVTINSSGLVDLTGAGANHHGIATEDCASGGSLAVQLKNAPGTRKAMASKAITVGTTIYAAASGKVSDAASGTAIGVCLKASAADGDIIEFAYS